MTISNQADIQYPKNIAMLFRAKVKVITNAIHETTAVYVAFTR